MISTYRLHGVSLDNKQESKIHGVKLQTFNKSGEVRLAINSKWKAIIYFCEWPAVLRK